MSELIESKTKALVVITGQQQKQIQALVEVSPPPCAVLAIESNDQFTEAGSKLLIVRGNLKQLEALHEDIAGPLSRSLVDIKTSVKKLTAFFDVPKRRLQQAEADIKVAMSKYLQVEESKRAAAQKLLDDAAAKEKARIKALADEAARKAAKAAQEARDAAIKDAAKGRVEQAKYHEANAAKIEAVASVRRDIADAKIASLDAPKVASEVPKAAGIAKRTTWQFEVLASALVPESYKIVDDRLIRKAIILGVRDIPGIRIFEQDDVVLTGK